MKRGAIVSGLGGLGLITLFSFPARSQVNAETLRRNPLTAGFSGSADVSLSMLRGNVEVIDVGGAGRVQYQTLGAPPETPGLLEERGLAGVRTRVFVTGSFRFGSRAAQTFVNQAFLHARYTYLFGGRLGPDVFAQVQLNELQRLTMRVVGGGGVRLEAIHTTPLMVALGTGAMAEYERIQVAEGAPDAPETLNYRSTSYLTARVALPGGTAILQNTAYFQPRWDDPGDLRVLNELELQVRISEMVSFGTTMSQLYDSRPPTGVKNIDMRLAQSLKLTF